MVPKLVLLALLASIACNEKAAPTAAPAPSSPKTPAQPATTPATPTPVAEPIPERANLETTDVEALVEQWLDAQNTGDFQAYSETYAKRLTGIKRVGDRETTFSRDAWLDDRKRMFRKTMKVSRDSQSISTGPASAVVRFEQTWQSGKFKDVGPKQLIVVREGDALRIAREEMKASTVVSSKRGLPVALEDLLFGAKGIEGFVLSPAEADWASGAIALKGSSPFIASRGTSAKLPDRWKKLVGTKITLYAGGAACQNTIESLHIVVGVTPHFMFFQDENGERIALDETAVARDIFDMGTPYLMARTVGSCTGDIAHLGTISRPISAIEIATTSGIDDTVRKAFLASAEYKSLQSDFESYSDSKPGPWAPSSLAVFQNKDEFIAIIAAEASDGCGGFAGALTHIYRVQENGSSERIGAFPAFFEVTEAMDIGSDGLVEFVGETHDGGTGAVTFIGAPNREKGYSELHRFGWDYHDCPC
tara:strand:+ start:8785 stop:10215 length:1431 start_codon:yes stop_codon:yes gene_type:complete